MINDKFYPLYNYILSAKDLSDCDKIVFSVIANLDREKGCTISNANLAQLCNKSQRTIIDSIGRLEKQGYITKTLTYTDKNNTLRTIKCTPIADICTPCENLHPLQDNVDTPCEILHVPPANIITPPVRKSAPKYNNNSIIDSKDNSIDASTKNLANASLSLDSNSMDVASKGKQQHGCDSKKAKADKWLNQLRADAELLVGEKRDDIIGFIDFLSEGVAGKRMADLLIVGTKTKEYISTEQYFELAKLAYATGSSLIGKLTNYAMSGYNKVSIYATIKNWYRMEEVSKSNKQRKY